MILPPLLQGASELPLEPLWGSAIGFVVVMTAVVGGIALAGRNLSVAATAAFMTMAFYGTTTDIQFLLMIMYVTVALVIIGFSFKIWRLEGFETGS